MSTKTLATSTVNTVAGFVVGAWLVTSGYFGAGLLVIVLGFLAGVVIVGNEMRRLGGK